MLQHRIHIYKENRRPQSYSPDQWLNYLEWHENRLLEVADDVLSQDERLLAIETAASWEDYEKSWHERRPDPLNDPRHRKLYVTSCVSSRPRTYVAEPQPEDHRTYEPDCEKNWGLRYP